MYPQIQKGRSAVYHVYIICVLFFTALYSKTCASHCNNIAQEHKGWDYYQHKVGKVKDWVRFSKALSIVLSLFSLKSNGNIIIDFDGSRVGPVLNVLKILSLVSKAVYETHSWESVQSTSLVQKHAMNIHECTNDFIVEFLFRMSWLFVIVFFKENTFHSVILWYKYIWFLLNILYMQEKIRMTIRRIF